METFLSYLLAFLLGGAVCVVAQLLLDLTRLTPARVLVIYVVAGVALGAVGLFEPIREIFGCGITVPLLGFGGNVALGVREAVLEEGLLGALTGGLRAAAGGTAAAIVFGYLAALIFGGKPKRM